MNTVLRYSLRPPEDQLNPFLREVGNYAWPLFKTRSNLRYRYMAPEGFLWAFEGP